MPHPKGDFLLSSSWTTLVNQSGSSTWALTELQSALLVANKAWAKRKASMTSEDEKAKSDAADAFEKLGVCRQLAVAAAELGWKTPTSIQEQAVPHLLAG